MTNAEIKKMEEKFFKVMNTSMMRIPPCAAIVGQLWDQFNNNRELFNNPYVKIEPCGCFETDIVFVFQELGYEVVKTIPLQNSSAVYAVLNKYN